MQSRLHVARFGRNRSVWVHRPGLTHLGMLKRIALPPLVVAAAMLVMAAPAQAQRQQADRVSFEQHFQRGDGLPSSQWDTPRRERSPERQDVPPSRVFQMLKDKYGGDKVNYRKQGDHYVISWVTGDGRRLNIRVNAKTGREE